MEYLKTLFLILAKEREQGPKVRLRSEPATLSEDDVKAMLKEKGFFDSTWNPEGNFTNEFVDNGDETITDRVTGIMWQQSGSDDLKDYESAKKEVERLNNEEHFAGYDDWRLPTVEEAASLLESEERNADLYIDPLFDTKQRWIWTSDSKEGSGSAWCVNFDRGYPDWGGFDVVDYVRVCRAAGQ